MHTRYARNFIKGLIDSDRAVGCRQPDTMGKFGHVQPIPRLGNSLKPWEVVAVGRKCSPSALML